MTAAIPDDVVKLALFEVANATHIDSRLLDPVGIIARAILAERNRATEAERERCAKLVEHRLGVVKHLVPAAAGAVFVALPAAIRAPSQHPAGK